MDVFRLVLYSLCVAASLACTVLLIRGFRQSRARLLLWSALCFVGLTINNLFLFADRLLLPDFDLRPVRLAAALVGVAFLLYGFIWETE